MDILQVIKAGFIGFALCVGVLMLVFFMVGGMGLMSKQSFRRVFLPAAVASFLAVDALLYYKVRVIQVPDSPELLVGCIGGWLSGLVSGAVQLKPYLMKLRG